MQHGLAGLGISFCSDKRRPFRGILHDAVEQFGECLWRHFGKLLGDFPDDFLNRVESSVTLGSRGEVEFGDGLDFCDVEVPMDGWQKPIARITAGAQTKRCVVNRYTFSRDPARTA